MYIASHANLLRLVTPGTKEQSSLVWHVTCHITCLTWRNYGTSLLSTSILSAKLWFGLRREVRRLTHISISVYYHLQYSITWFYFHWQSIYWYFLILDIFGSFFLNDGKRWTDRQQKTRFRHKAKLLSYCDKTIQKWAFPVHDFCFSLSCSDRGSWSYIQIWEKQKRDLNIRLNLLHPWNDSCFSKLFWN